MLCKTKVIKVLYQEDNWKLGKKTLSYSITQEQFSIKYFKLLYVDIDYRKRQVVNKIKLPNESQRSFKFATLLFSSKDRSWSLSGGKLEISEILHVVVDIIIKSQFATSIWYHST